MNKLGLYNRSNEREKFPKYLYFAHCKNYYIFSFMGNFNVKPSKNGDLKFKKNNDI